MKRGPETEHTVQISPSDHEPQRDSSLVDSLDVVRRPANRVRNARVDAHGAQEHARVLYMRFSGAQKHRKAYDSETGHEHVTVAWFALLASGIAWD